MVSENVKRLKTFNQILFRIYIDIYECIKYIQNQNMHKIRWCICP